MLSLKSAPVIFAINPKIPRKSSLEKFTTLGIITIISGIRIVEKRQAINIFFERNLKRAKPYAATAHVATSSKALTI